ncbi:MAG: hypothetical protein ACM31O_04045, partial [Bacteroidota bacterium]
MIKPQSINAKPAMTDGQLILSVIYSSQFVLTKQAHRQILADKCSWVPRLENRRHKDPGSPRFARRPGTQDLRLARAPSKRIGVTVCALLDRTRKRPRLMR